MKKSKMKYKSNRLTGTAVLRDKFVPKHLNAINLAPVATRWVLCNGSFNADGSPNDMEPVIAKMAENFIPRVPCMCGETPEPIHGSYYYSPSPVHRVPPDFQFALRDNAHYYFNQADLDETTSIQEYSSTFRGALRSENEERMRMYEKYSLLKWPLRRLDARKAVIHIKGICDARPSLQVADIVLLRPIQPLVALMPNRWGTMEAQQYTIEIESRILHIIRGKRDKADRIIISWALNLEERDALKDHSFVREYSIRFFPSSATIDRCLTALNWLENLAVQQDTLGDVLFPVTAPIVKPLTAEQRQVFRGVPTSANYSSQIDISDIGKPLNQLQSSFVRMVRARTQDPNRSDKTRPPMILTGPAGTGKTKTLIYAIADVLGLLHHGQPNQQHQKNTNRVLVCCPSHAASDVLTRRLSGLLKRSEIFRMFDASRPSSTVPGYILPFTCQVPGLDTFTLPPPSVWTGLRAIICTCMDAHLLFRAQITNRAIRAKQQCFRTFLLSESNPLGLSFGQVTVNADPFFTHLFVDEAAQATEPEILCPISCVVDPHLGGRKVEICLIGDPRQLSPRVFASNVSDNLGRSFMERLLRRPVTCMGGGEESLLGPAVQHDSLLDNAGSLDDLIRYYAQVDGQEQLTIFLTENYRGHPSFLMMPSSFFYFDRLRSAKVPDPPNLAFWVDRLRKVEALTSPVADSIETPGTGVTSPMSDMFAQIHRQTTWPMHFRGVKGSDSSIALENFSGTDSWQNIVEAGVTVEIISTLIKNGVEPSRIGAMSPFRGQVILIRKLLREKYYHDVNVGTIENYQAVEQDVIVLSLTRASGDFVDHDVEKGMGIFGQPKQLNVAMTRAENLFIVVGNPNVMWQDPCWRQWLRFCCRNGLWYGQGLLQWKKVQSISLKDMRFVSTLDLTKKAEDGKQSPVVVSTLEKIHKIHRLDQE